MFYNASPRPRPWVLQLQRPTAHSPPIPKQQHPKTQHSQSSSQTPCPKPQTFQTSAPSRDIASKPRSLSHTHTHQNSQSINPIDNNLSPQLQKPRKTPNAHTLSSTPQNHLPPLQKKHNLFVALIEPSWNPHPSRERNPKALNSWQKPCRKPQI